MKTNIRAIFSRHTHVTLYNVKYGIRVATLYNDHRYYTITFKSRDGERVVWKAYNMNELCCLYSDALYIARRNAQTR